MNLEIFRSYDIRGVYPSEINEDIVYKIGRAFVVFLKKINKAKTVVIGRDIRTSSVKLFKALAKGITDQGADVIDLGECSTPMVYYASGTLKTDGAVMITASHNPPEYNGLKFCREDVIPVSYDTGLNKMQESVKNNNFEEAGKGKITEKDIHEQYKEFLLKDVSVLDVKAVVDTANGIAVKEAEILKDVCNVIPLFWELDGTQPNHEANPLKTETLKALQEKVIKEKADLGIAYDGDGDRAAFIDEKGETIPSDLITGLLSKDYKGKKILYDIRSSKSVPEEIRKNGNTPIRCRVGHSYIKQQMRDENAVFAGELSGHYYYKETFTAESSTTTAIKIMELIKDKTLSEVIRPLRKYFHSEEINSEVEDKDAKIEEIKEKYSDGKQDFLDGITVEYDDWWFNVRKSGTEQKLRLVAEANTKEKMEEKVKEVLSVIRR